MYKRQALYLLFLVIIGIPLMLAAITLGRKTQLSVFSAYKSIDKRWSFVGALAVICGFVILAFYSAVGGWVPVSYTHLPCALLWPGRYMEMDNA